MPGVYKIDDRRGDFEREVLGTKPGFSVEQEAWFFRRAAKMHGLSDLIHD
jgi:hypothetical protein